MSYPHRALRHLNQSPSKKIIVLLVLVIGFSVNYSRAQQHDTPTGKNPFAGNPDAIKAGKDIFNQSCAMCHGTNGEGGSRGPALNTGSFKRANDDAALHDIV
ncbi:MAG TPA: c-type cytochrome, partial [Blastocatellia bacterium]|nr:c-type cytochrome [Blastocatellia bacterium]